MFGFKRKKKGLPTVDGRLSHIAFIMDGNGRWAQAKGMPREYGHKAGAETFRRVIRMCGDIGIEIKRSRPAPSVLLRQLRGYAESPQVDELIVICEHLPRLPATVCGKPLHALSLNRLWGIAL